MKRLPDFLLCLAVFLFAAGCVSEPAGTEGQTVVVEDTASAENAVASTDVEATEVEATEVEPIPGPLWTWEGEGGSMALFGSLHFGTPELYPLPALVERSYEAADGLVVEVNVAALDPGAMQVAIFRYGMLPSGRTLSSLLTDETRDRLEGYLRSHELALSSVDRLKPWLVTQMVDALALRRLGYDESQGIDRYFMARAAADGRAIVELESVDSQLGLMDSFSLEKQVGLLQLTLDEVTSYEERMRRLFETWRSADWEAFLGLMGTESAEAMDPLMEEYNELLFHLRNRQMASRLAELLRGGGRWFVVVGAGHLLGRDSIPALLAAEGYDFTRQ